MHTTVDYSKEPAPRHRAIEDIKDWLGQERWDAISPQMAKITDVDQFMVVASFAGISGFPVRAWYDLYHGEGAFERAFRL